MRNILNKTIFKSYSYAEPLRVPQHFLPTSVFLGNIGHAKRFVSIRAILLALCHASLLDQELI
jgi:hypothetical protein